MAITTYAELQDAAARWLNRQDLGAHIGDFIALAEARIGADLRTADAETVATLTTATGVETLDLPADYQEARGVALNGAGGLSYMTPAALVETYGWGGGGRPVAYTVIGRKLRFGPTPDAAYALALTYYAKAPALSDALPSNWLLTQHPNLLLYATLIETAPFLGDDARTAVWGGLYDAALGRIQDADGRARWGGGPLTINVG